MDTNVDAKVQTWPTKLHRHAAKICMCTTLNLKINYCDAWTSLDQSSAVQLSPVISCTPIWVCGSWVRNQSRIPKLKQKKVTSTCAHGTIFHPSHSGFWVWIYCICAWCNYSDYWVVRLQYGVLFHLEGAWPKCWRWLLQAIMWGMRRVNVDKQTFLDYRCSNYSRIADNYEICLCHLADWHIQ